MRRVAHDGQTSRPLQEKTERQSPFESRRQRRRLTAGVTPVGTLQPTRQTCPWLGHSFHNDDLLRDHFPTRMKFGNVDTRSNTLPMLVPAIPFESVQPGVVWPLG